MILNEIISFKKKDLEEMKSRFPLSRLTRVLERTVRSDPRPFQKAISAPRGINLICEIKKSSPSEGVLREKFQPLRIAAEYEHAGAAAISVLTEPHFFHGRPSYLKTVRQVTRVPLLRKDFIFESYQIYESALLEADAFLLIASILTGEELSGLIRTGHELGMDALVEVHTEEDLKKAVDAGARIVGINNRNLKTLEVNPQRALQLLPHVPKQCAVVVESGLTSHSQLLSYKNFGVHAFLVGSHLMKKPDLVQAVESLLGRDLKWRKDEA